MNTEQIATLINMEKLPDIHSQSAFLETPEAWFIQSDKYSFKIRKPIRKDGLDLSDPEMRKVVCDEELRLNKDLAGSVYCEVIPISTEKPWKPLTLSDDEEVEYALKVRRLDKNQNLMYRLENFMDIDNKLVVNLARRLAKFHKSATPVMNSFNISRLNRRFEESKRIRYFLRDIIGSSQHLILLDAIAFSRRFLSDKRYVLQERAITGYVRDGHGNLCSENIYLMKNPVITGRSLRKEQRYNDVLFDIARLGIDFDYYGRSDLNELFLKQYLEHFPHKDNEPARQLYTYYKLYRCNQLLILLVDNSTIYDLTDANIETIRHYSALMDNYLKALS